MNGQTEPADRTSSRSTAPDALSRDTHPLLREWLAAYGWSLSRSQGDRASSRGVPPDALAPDAHPLLRELLAAYQRAFDEAGARASGFRSRWGLTHRFLTHHARASTTELQRALHAQMAVGGERSGRESLLNDLDHYGASLRPPLSSFTRTLVVLAIALVAQLLGRLPLIPIVSGPDRKPALGWSAPVSADTVG